MIGVSTHLLSIVFRFHYHSQDVIGSPGWNMWGRGSHLSSPQTSAFATDASFFAIWLNDAMRDPVWRKSHPTPPQKKNNIYIYIYIIYIYICTRESRLFQSLSFTQIGFLNMIPLGFKKNMWVFSTPAGAIQKLYTAWLPKNRLQLAASTGGYKRTEESNTLFAVQNLPPFDIFSNLDVEVSARKVSSWLITYFYMWHQEYHTSVWLTNP